MSQLLQAIAESASSAGKGALAGAVATGAMTLSSSVEMKIRDRPVSDVPSAVAGRVLGVQPRDPRGRKRFGALVHWGYGTAWGALGGLIHHWVPGRALASSVHLGSVWGTEVAMLPALGQAPPVQEWGAREISIDLFHHFVYVAAFAGVWFLLERQAPRPWWRRLFG